MISIEHSYKVKMSSNEFYEFEKESLSLTIKQEGDPANVMSRSGDSGVSQNIIKIIDGFYLTEDLEIVSEERISFFDPPTLKRQPIKSNLRFAIFKRNDYRCQMCGVTARDGATLEIDHIHPVARGGTNDADNLQVLCRDCNAGKGVQCL